MGNEQPPVTGESQTLRFGTFELDLRARELRRNGSRIRLQEQPYQVLLQLLERPGDVVSREELQARLWPADTFVDFDHSLNAAIRRLRDALGDSAENPRFVETVSRRGYRFLAPVTKLGEQQELPPFPAAAPMRSSRPAWHYALLLVLAVALASVLLHIGMRVGSMVGRHRAAAAQVKISQLTANPIDDRLHAAAISPDGKYLAFSDETGFYLRQIETGETHPVALPSELKVESIGWFPDSVHMALGLSGAKQAPSLWVVSAMGGEPRKLKDNGRLPAVSPDGNEIAFIVGRHFNEQIWLVRADGSQPRRLIGEEGDFFGDVVWSPDGSRIAYTRGKPAEGYGVNEVIETVDVKTESAGATPSTLRIVPLTRLDALDAPLIGLDSPLAWTSDGRLLYVMLEGPPRQGDSNVWSVALDESGHQLAPPVRLTNDSGHVFDLSVTSDGKRIVFTRGLPEPDVYIARIETPGSISEPRRLTLDDHADIPYDWTADGKSVIFISDRTGTASIYRQAVDQTVPELLIRGSNPVESRLSPDGTQLLYVEFAKWGENNATTPLMRVPLAGGAPQKVLEEKWISNHQCARTPASICVYSMVGDRKLTFFAYDPFKGKGNPVFEMNAEFPQLFNWTLSPDGNTLAVAEAKTDQKPRIRLVNLQKSEKRWLEIKGPAIASFDWAADSKSLWASVQGEDNALVNVDLQGNIRTVWRPEKKSVGWAIPSRDGRYLALHVVSSSANAWMLESQSTSGTSKAVR